jgi:hypothetical protein
MRNRALLQDANHLEPRTFPLPVLVESFELILRYTELINLITPFTVYHLLSMTSRQPAVCESNAKRLKSPCRISPKPVPACTFAIPLRPFGSQSTPLFLVSRSLNTLYQTHFLISPSYAA